MEKEVEALKIKIKKMEDDIRDLKRKSNQIIECFDEHIHGTARIDNYTEKPDSRWTIYKFRGIRYKKNRNKK
jgi:hypothetical protein